MGKALIAVPQWFHYLTPSLPRPCKAMNPFQFMAMETQSPHRRRQSYRDYAAHKAKAVPGKPVAYYKELLWLICGLLWGIVAYSFGLLGFPGSL